MPLLPPADLEAARRIHRIAFSNPFLPHRVELEREALGPDYVPFERVKARRADDRTNPNTARLVERSRDLRRGAIASAERGETAVGDELGVLAVLARFELYHAFLDELFELARRSADARGSLQVRWYPRFRRAVEEGSRLGPERLLDERAAPDLLALFFQFARAFHFVYASLAGRSEAATRLRAAIWESVFTHDVDRYVRSLRGRMADVSTLVTGPSGTGKELVARAIAHSGWLPFDEQGSRFELDVESVFLPLNLSALSRDLLESELFGHRRGAFTGALDDRRSALERCCESGTVFLDEIGETDPRIQVKLLRVLQTRHFQRVGDHETRTFCGRLVSATNRDLAAEIRAGRFREDLYYRLCSDRIRTPPLAELIAGDRDELEHLVTIVARGILGGDGTESDEVADFARETTAFVVDRLGLDYAWPGNFRELEQCARACLVRGEYVPDRGEGEEADIGAVFSSGAWTADRLLRHYCRRVYALAGSYEAAARKLDLDRRTVKAKLADT